GMVWKVAGLKVHVDYGGSKVAKVSPCFVEKREA
ncbi:unnamed protein product, partial [marine sediment metagenome]